MFNKVSVHNPVIVTATGSVTATATITIPSGEVGYLLKVIGYTDKLTGATITITNGVFTLVNGADSNGKINVDLFGWVKSESANITVTVTGTSVVNFSVIAQVE